MTTPSPGSGTLLDDRYLLEGLLGSGGMGDVFRARDQAAGDAPVAVKVLNAQASAAVRARFLREARLASQLRHPHIVPVLTYARRAAERLYLVMELVDGAPLSQLMRDLPAAQLVGLLSQVLGALAHVHARGVLHRDIKPDNILIARRADGQLQARLTDFGIAGMTDPDRHDETRLTQEGSMIGTPHYMAPEQAAGELYIGPPADLYPIGVMVYETLAGSLPFEGPPLTILLDKLQGEVPAPDNLATWPEGLWDLTRQLLARTPATRPRSAAELRTQLAPYAEAPRIEAARWSTLCGAAAGDLRPSPPGADEAALAPTSASGPAPASDALWGRRPERRALMALADAAEAEQLRIGVIRGPLGIGKSALARDVELELAESGRFERLHGGFGPGTGARGLRIIVERAMGTLGRSRAEAEMLARGFLERHGTVDEEELREVVAFLRPAASEVAAAAPFRQHALALRVLRLKARRGPLMVVLEDAHHAMGDVIRFLQMVAVETSYEPMALLVLLTSRSDQDAALMAALEPLLRPGGPATDIALGPLAADVLADGLRARYGIPLRHAEAIASRAAGNPLFAELLMTANATLAAPTPSRLSDVGALPERLRGMMLGQLEDRLEAQPGGAALRPLLDRLALLGSPVATELLEAFCRDLEGDFDDMLDRLVRLEVLDENVRDDTLGIRHPLLEEALLAGLTGRKVRKLHARAAELRQQHGDPVDREAGAIGRHLCQAGRTGEAVDWWLRGLRWELAAGNGLRAVYCAEQALEHLPSEDPRALTLRLELGKLRLERGAIREAIAAVTPVAEGPDPLLAVEALAFSYRLEDELANRQEASRLAERLRVLALSDAPDVRRAAERAQLYVLNTMLRADEAAAMARRLLAEAPDADDRFYILQRLCFSVVILHSLGVGKGTELVDQVRDLLEESDALLPHQSPSEWLAAVHASSGIRGILFGYDAVRPLLTEAQALLRRQGRPGQLLRMMLREVYAALMNDRFHRARDLLDEGRRMVELFPMSELRLRHGLFDYMARSALGEDTAALAAKVEATYATMQGGSMVAHAKGWFRLIGAYRAAREQRWSDANRYLDENKDFGIRGLGIPRAVAEDMKRLLRPVRQDWPAIDHWLATIDMEWAKGFPHKEPLAG